MEKGIRIEELISLPDKVSLPIIASQRPQVHRAIRKFCHRLERTEFQGDLLEVLSFHNKVGSWLDNGTLSARQLGLTKDDLMALATKALRAETAKRCQTQSLKLKSVLNAQPHPATPLILETEDLIGLHFIKTALKHKVFGLPPWCANPKHLTRHDLRIIEQRLSSTGQHPPKNKIC